MADLFTVMTARTRDLNESDRQTIIRVCNAAQETDAFDPFFSYMPSDGLHVIGRLNRDIVSHAVITTRWAQADDTPLLRTAYIDAVCTQPDLHGKGYGSKVMRQIAQSADDEGYELSALETEIAPFYERLGWEVWRGELAGRGDDGLVPTPESKGNILILRFGRTPPLNINGLLTIEVSGRIW